MSMSPSPPPFTFGIVPRGRPVCDSLPHYSSLCVGPLATESWTCQYCQRRYSSDVSGGYVKRVVKEVMDDEVRAAHVEPLA
ncbi:hypothetical protein CcaverHIS002_0606220 [Cutaneotrichosporon cavernicola]|nr:hypothetical protein CcaverHIS002_0606220 [Cutaneotrichosporon cavernicola]BEJ01888.1 hypothetical protein CcaverHIS631_0605700 [Cutaneotrichosporon cavernicola]BEJ09654.1 hypothetical protein CcaverHIS641_0605690 [Cutaneotrichosporon cavernicola]